MPFTQSAGNWTVGIGKQTNEGTVNTVAAYQFPVYAGTPSPTQDLAQVAVTDGTAITPDSYKKAGEHWTSHVETPAFADMLGLVLVGLWPTDNKTGAGPYTHTYTGFAATPPWFTMFSDAPSLVSTFEAGIMSAFSIAATQDGGPARITFDHVGKRPTVAAHTTTINAAVSDGYFSAVGAALKFDEDTSTPATVTNIESFTLTCNRPVTPVVTADGLTVSNLGLGLADSFIDMTLLWVDWQAYRATYYGTVGGSTPSVSLPKGSVELNFVHSIQAGWSLKFTIPAVLHLAAQPTPDPSAPPLTVQVHGDIQKPGSGDPVQPTLINAVAVAY